MSQKLLSKFIIRMHYDIEISKNTVLCHHLSTSKKMPNHSSQKSLFIHNPIPLFDVLSLKGIESGYRQSFSNLPWLISLNTTLSALCDTYMYDFLCADGCPWQAIRQ